MKHGIVILTMFCVMLVSGCNETQKFGQGDPPVEWQETFGNDNLARLNFVQVQTLNQLNDRVVWLEQENPAELAKRVKGLEVEMGLADPNGGEDG